MRLTCVAMLFVAVPCSRMAAVISLDHAFTRVATASPICLIDVVILRALDARGNPADDALHAGDRIAGTGAHGVDGAGDFLSKTRSVRQACALRRQPRQNRAPVRRHARLRSPRSGEEVGLVVATSRMTANDVRDPLAVRLQLVDERRRVIDRGRNLVHVPRPCAR